LLSSTHLCSIRVLILVEPSFLDAERQRQVRDSDVVDQHRHALTRGGDDLLAESLKRNTHRTEEILRLQVAARLETRLAAFDVLTPPNPEFRMVVARLSAPTLLVMGDSHLVITPELAAGLQALNGKLKVREIRNAGHGLPFDQPEELAAVIREFCLAAEQT
jgi:N-formylmaleamate deformylase